MIRVLLLCVFASLASPASAQTLSTQFAYTDDVYRYVSLRQVEADGNPATVDWLAHAEPPPGITDDPPAFRDLYRVIAVNAAGAICRGPWFVVWPAAYPDVTHALTRINGRDVFLITEPQPLDRSLFPRTGGFGETRFYVIALDRPRC